MSDGERLDLRRREADGEVDGAELEVLRQGVLIDVELEDHLVGLGTPPQYCLSATQRTNLPFCHSTTWNGPEPTIGGELR